jgi:hypothetical protein
MSGNGYGRRHLVCVFAVTGQRGFQLYAPIEESSSSRREDVQEDVMDRLFADLP